MTSFLLARELVMLAILGAFGAGAMALVPREDLRGGRLALAPSAGLAIGAGVLLTINLVLPLRHAWLFAVVPAAFISYKLVQRARLRRPAARELAGIAIVLAVALGSGSYALVKRDSPGPVGYGIFDAGGYVTFVQGYERYTSHDPLLKVNLEGNAASSGVRPLDWGQPWDLSERYGWAYRWQHTASLTVPATAAGFGGWAPWTMIGAFVAVLLATGALGVYGLAGLLGAGPLARTLGGVAYAGPLVITAGMNGSVGLLAGLAALPAVLTAAIVAFERPTRRTALIAGALVGGLQAVYPELTPAVIGGLLIAALLRFGIPLLRGHATRASLRPVLRALPWAVLAALVIGLRAVPWTWGYLVDDHYSQFRASLVPYQVGVRYIPGWLYQTREFYSFAFSKPAGALQTVVGILLPLGLMGISAAAFVSSRRARWLGGILIAVLLQAWWASKSFGCAYCVERSLLITAPLVPALLVTGASLLAARGGRGRDAVVVLGTLAVVAVGATAITVQQRIREGAIFVPRALETATRAAGNLKATTLLEGFGSTPYSSWLTGPVTYAALTESGVPRVSTVPVYDEWGGLAYYGVRHDPGNPAWTPGYQTVVTRYGGAEFPGRTPIAAAPPYFVEQRAHPFDVSIVAGVATDQPYRDPNGTPWVQPPGNQAGRNQQALVFWVSAESPKRAYLRLRFAGPPDLKVKDVNRLGKVRLRHNKSGTTDVCAPLKDMGATRRADFNVNPEPPLLGPPLRRYENAPQPAMTTRLVRVAATEKPCG
ncbi:MAG: hypothetical protein JWR63_168 [Conexibacter sp.]|nr:hypothetical protein [Conexibacter sp.]